MEQHQNYADEENARETDPAAVGLGLVERTAELLKAAETHAAEVSARSAAAVAHLQEEMRLAERVLEAAETRRRVAESEVKTLKADLEELEKKYQERIDNLNADLLAAQIQATRSEERALESEGALARIQNAMQGMLKNRAEALKSS